MTEMSNQLAPGVFRARSEARTSDNGGRAERRPRQKYYPSYCRAMFRRALKKFRYAAFEEQRKRIDAWGLGQLASIGSQLEQPPKGNFLCRREYFLRWVDVSARPTTVAEAARWSLEERFTPASREREGTLSRRSLVTPSFRREISHTVRVVGSRLYKVLAHVRPVWALRKAAKLYADTQSGLCLTCGGHSDEYTRCDFYQRTRRYRFLACMRDIGIMAWTNRLDESFSSLAYFYLATDVELARFRGESISLLDRVGTTMKYKASKFSRVARGIEVPYRVASDVFYVVTGHILSESLWAAAGPLVGTMRAGLSVAEALRLTAVPGASVYLPVTYDRLNELLVIMAEFGHEDAADEELADFYRLCAHLFRLRGTEGVMRYYVSQVGRQLFVPPFMEWLRSNHSALYEVVMTNPTD